MKQNDKSSYGYNNSNWNYNWNYNVTDSEYVGTCEFVNGEAVYYPAKSNRNGKSKNNRFKY